MLIPLLAILFIVSVYAQTVYYNPVLGENVADPAVTAALDGFYYVLKGSMAILMFQLYATRAQLYDNPFVHLIPIFRSVDLVSWEFVGDAFKESPEWALYNDFWAPDLHYINGSWHMYYTVSGTGPLEYYNTPSSNTSAAVTAIGLAISDSPAGPFADSGPPAGANLSHGPVVPPRWGATCDSPENPHCYNQVIDSYVFQSPSGTRHIYTGSFTGGNIVSELSEDCLTTVSGTEIQYGHSGRYEASYMITHWMNGSYYNYMLNSQFGCCAADSSGYSVVASRSLDPTGSFMVGGSFFCSLLTQ